MKIYLSGTCAVITLGIALFIGACNSSSTSSNSTDTSASKMSSDTTTKTSKIKTEDSDHLSVLLSANYDEVKILQLALTKTIPGDLKTTFQKMLSDHQSAINSLKTLASQKNITVPDSSDEQGVNKYDGLNKENGKSFEKDFLEWLIATHKDAIAKCQDYSKNALDHDVASWCTATLPTLQSHLQMAEAAQSKLSPMNSK